MTQTAEALAESFKANKVTRIAIVDDGYDMPDTTAISEQRWLGFSTAVDEAEGSFGRHQDVLRALGDLPTYGDLRNEHVQVLWRHHTSLVFDPSDQREENDEIARELANAFSSFAGRKMQKLEQLRHVERTAKEAIGQDPACFPSAVSGAELRDFDLIFLDFFLGDEVNERGEVSTDMLAAAEARACRLVQEVTAAARPKAAPLFVVISSLASNDNVPDFRDNARLLASKFRFLAKKDIEVDPGRRDFILRGLASQRAAGDAVEHLTHNWHESIGNALADMMTSIRRLDIADYAYIQTYRLTEEKVSLLSYLTWLYNSYLGSFVEERLANTESAATAPLSALKSPSAILRPMSEIPKIYSRVMTTKVKGFADKDSSAIWTGDVFVRKSRLAKYADAAGATERAAEDAPPVAAGAEGQVRPEPLRSVESGRDGQAESIPETGRLETAAVADGAEKKGEETSSLPDVAAAVTPVCDLVPGRIKAKNIVLVGGELTELQKAKEASNHLFVYERSGMEKSVEFQIKWDPKAPMSYPIATFDGEGVKGTDYVRVTRLRELYAAEIAQGLAADLARVGVPIAPPFTRPLDVEVRVVRNKQPILSTVGVARRPFAWDLAKKKSGPAREVVFSEDFLWAFVQAVRDHCPADGPCIPLVADFADLEGLLQPFSSASKYPTKAGKKISVRADARPGDNQGPTGEELISILLFDTVD